MSRRRPIRRHLERNGIIAAALFAPFLLVVALIAYTLQSERSRSETERRVLRDYSIVSGAEFQRQAAAMLHDQVALALRPAARDAKTGAHLRGPRPLADPAVLLRESAGADSCVLFPHLVGAFRLELPSGRLVVAGDFPASSEAPLVRQVIEAATPHGEPHRVLVATRDGGMRVVAMEVVPHGRAGESVVYGVETDARALGAVFERILAGKSMVPSELLRPPHDARHLRVRVAGSGGATIWENAPPVPSAAVAVDTFPPHLGAMVASVQAGPAVAAALRIGRPSPLYVPALGAMLVLSAGLAVVALVQLRRAREMARLRTRFVANVSHELRTPLTQISMFAEMLARGRHRDGEERQRYAEIIRREVARLSTMVDGVMRFARSEEGRTSVVPERRELAVEVRAAVEFFAPVAMGADVTVEVSVGENVWADVDPGALRQVLLNLLDNAVKYGPRGQAVRIAVTRVGGEAAIVVSDEGPGIPRSERERIFEPYVRLERPDLPRVAGTGIGLAVVRELVHAHGGTVRLGERERGTEVIVHLPLATPPMRGERVEASATPEPTAVS